MCGGTDDLEVHHKDPTQKGFEVANSWGRPWAAIVVELEKCELRCAAHHREAHAPKHGTPSCYRNRKCRCEACVKANSAVMKGYKARYIAKLKAQGVS